MFLNIVSCFRSSLYQEKNINNLDDNTLINIFEHLPVEDILKVPKNVCTRWTQLAPDSWPSKKSLFLHDRQSTSLLRYMYMMFSTTFDCVNMYQVGSETLTEDFAKSILKLFPKIERLEVAFDFNNDLRPFLFTLIKGYSSRLVHLKIIFCKFEPPSNPRSRIFMFSSSSLTAPLLSLFSFLREECPLPNLRHLTLYRQKDDQPYVEPLSFPFEVVPLLQELNYGVPTGFHRLEHALEEMKKAPMIRRFAIYFDYVDHETPRLHTYFDNLDNQFGKQMTHFTIFYTHHFADVSKYFDSLTQKLTNLQYLSISLKHERIHIDELLESLTRLSSLRHLELSCLPLNYMTEKFEDYCKDVLTDGKELPQLKSVNTLKFSYTNWENYNCFDNVIKWKQIFPLVSKCFPGLKQVQHSHIRNKEFINSYANPNKKKSDNLNDADETVQEDFVLDFQKSLNMDFPANLSYLDASQILLSPSKLISVLSKTNLLQYLRIRAPRNFFFKFGQLEQSEVRMNSLTTLHLDHISTGHGDPSEIIACLDLTQTVSLWPNLRNIKLDGLRANYNYFDLSAREVEWLLTLPTAWRQLKRVFIMNRSFPRLPTNHSSTGEHNDAQHALFQVTYFLRDKALPNDEPKRVLTVVHQS